MKDKPVSHKNQNTFKFLTFAERIGNINIDVIHQIGKISASPDEANTFFLEAIEKWVDLNYTQDYEELQKEIGPEIRNLSQIVFRQDEIIEILLKYLKKEGSLALDAVLELTVALARDLQYDFYPHFPKFFSAITLHLSSKDTELLEKLFTCLAYLFKFLWRYMVKDMKNVYRLFSSLLSDSNREHIRIFAVESFAFLIRKVQDKEDLFSFIFKELQLKPEHSVGVGQLFFEVVKGVKEQFHSCTENVMKLVLKFLGNEDFTVSLIEKALQQMLQSMAKHTTPKHSFIVQKIFCDFIEELINQLGVEENKRNLLIEHLDKVLHLFLSWINFKNGKLIFSDKCIIKVLTDLCNINSLPQYCMRSVADIISSVLISGCVNLPVDKINMILTQIYSQSEEIFFHFTRNMFKYGMFEKDLLPLLLSSCMKLMLSDDARKKKSVLQILSETVTSLKPILTSGSDIKSFTKLYLYAPTKNSMGKKCLSYASASTVLEKFLIETLCFDELARSNLPEIWAALVCLPHIRFLNTENVSKVLQELAIKMHKYLLSTQFTNLDHAEEWSFTLCQAYFVFLVITADYEKENCFNTKFFIDLLKKHSRSLGVLRMVDLHLRSYKKLPSLEELGITCEELTSHVIPNLASPYHLERLFTLQILNALELSPTQSEDRSESVLNICIEAERISLDVQSYREKVKWLRKLEYLFVEKNIPIIYDTLLKKVPVYYLLGNLYINFKLLWDPSISVLETYAHGTTELFWNVFAEHLNKITALCETGENADSSLKTENESETYSAFYQSLTQFCKRDENPDIINHRLLLWKSMAQFPDVVEPKNKTIVPFLFRFMTNEVVKVDTSMAATESVNKMQWDEDMIDAVIKEKCIESEITFPKRKRRLKQNTPQKSKKLKSESEKELLNDTLDKDESIDMIDVSNEEGESDSDGNEESESEVENEEEEEEILQVPQTKMTKTSAKRKRHVAKTLAALLSVFAKFKNPKAIYKTEELQKLYNELLSYHDPDIQKLSFDCLMTYNYKYLVPYKDNFYRILDNKTFKSEVVLFSLDTENHVVQEQHRINVLPVLMRIMYGKMLYKTGNNTTGKSQAQTRRSLVLRFLAGCKAEELKMFFDLVFLPFKEQLNDDTLTAVKKIRESIDLSNVVPIRRQHSALNTLGLILQHLGNLIPELLYWLLKVLLIITATSVTLLEKREEVLPQCVTILKAVRTQAVMKLMQFFKSFPQYDFKPEEIDAIFESIVWPILPRLEHESINQPSPLLRLLATWSEKPRYFVLFAKYHGNSASLTPLPHLMDLYSCRRTKSRVVGVISKIIFQLLTLENETSEKEEKLPPLQINCHLSLLDVIIDGVPASFGTKLLLPFVDKILSRIEMTVSIVTKKKVKKSVSTRDLTILLRISKYVNDSSQCSKLIHLLIPFFQKSKIDPDSEVLILNTISNLIKKAEDIEDLTKLLAPLFGKLSNQNTRLALCTVFSTLAEIKPEMHKMASIIEKVNAFDPNMVSEPNYQERLNGHKETLEIIRGMDKTSVNEDFLRIIIYNASFMIRTYDDLALRNSASYLLQESAKVFATVMPDFQELCNLLIFDTLLPEVQKGLKCNLEAIRHEFIGILSAVLHSCKDHPRLKDLFALCDEDTDLDFWENMRHLQVHRRARALLRFSNHLKNQHEHGEKIAVHYLLAYMIPIVSSFLFDEAYRKHVHVVDAAIETLGSIANVLPWHHYEPLLKNYLNMLSKNAEHHKTVVKIIVSLLNAFHFDLTLKKENSFTSVHDENKTSHDLTEEIDMKDVSAECFEKDVKETVEVVENDVNQASDLTPAMAKKIYNTIKRNILPLLHRSLMRKAKSDDEHKYAGHYYPEDEEILRVPIALAMVKLLQKLPPGSLEKNLPGLLLKMCDLLKSRTESIRETTRDTLVKMMQSLGPKYFHCLLSEMKSVMKKGYQVHVMTFTINTVLVSLSNQMVSGDLDESVKDLTEICISELFSDVAEEKEVAKITGKLKEARSFKSYSIFQILSKYVSENLLLELITPLKEVLERKYSYKAMKKVAECLRHIALGLSDNNGVSPRGHLIFIHAVINENIPGLSQKKKPEMSKTSKFVRPDIFLVPKEPGRSGPPAKINKRTNAHVLVEFGLQLFTFCLKKDKIDKHTKEILEMLDPFVALLSDCLTSNHIKIISTSLRCLLSLYKFPLPSLKTVTKNIVNSLFILINKYSATGMGQGENFEMILMCFKVLTVLVRDTSYHKLSDEQLHSLLSYVEQDIYDYTRQATAFSLLKAILSKKLEAPVLRGIMIKIAEMSITAEQDFVRTQCRQTCLQYILDYPLGKHLVKTISFFIAQLEYLHEHGRISAFEMINSMLESFPEATVKKHSALFMVPLAARLVNDESAKCRKMAALCLKQLFIKVEHDGRLSLYSIVLNWLQAKKLSHKRLGTQVCGIFAEVEGEQFESHLNEILPIMTELISIRKNEAKSNTDERCEDHFLYHLLNSLVKILTYCPIIKKEEFSEKLNVIWENVQGLILHPHVWVRLATSQLFGLLLSTYTVEEICGAIYSKKKTVSVYINTKQKLRDLSADFATQLQSLYLYADLGEQIVRNLVYIAKVNSKLSELSYENINESSENVEVTLEWIIRKLCREAKKEVADSPKSSERRRCVFMFIAAIAHELGKEKLSPMLNSILVPLCREISDASEHPDKDLKKTAQEVLDLLANIVGIEEFTAAYADVQSSLFKKKMKRKQEKAQEAVTNPQRYALKRIEKQAKKKELKKRRILKQKGKKKPKKKTLSDLAYKK